ncbi:MAG: two-component sensor histidine kinase [Thiohalocapsa sp.]|nr:two-component sensor histidine kinase [Thiohalocapsa sp.]
MSRLTSSYRFRLPLALSLTAIVTAVFMAAALGLQSLHNLREDQGRNALRLAHAMSHLLVGALRQDDVWLAYSLLRGPDGADGTLIWIVADADDRVFASNRPRDFRLGQPLREALPLIAEMPPAADPTGTVIEVREADVRRVLHLPLFSENTGVGNLYALLSDEPFLHRFHEVVLGGVAVTAAVLALLLPVGWLSGRRMVTPLVDLAQCMARVGRVDPRDMECRIRTGDDEIGQLGRCFKGMLGALAEKAQLERRVVQTERLAAVGRVAAGVAHEINNPLGGMVMAIDTYRGGGPLDARNRQLLDLLDRGLRQIQSTVSALLVEARADRRTLTRDDFEDVRTLVEPRVNRRGAPLDWHVTLDAATSLPATPVRQLLLNLVLNALSAAGEGGRAVVHVTASDSGLCMLVENTGTPLPPERLDYLFEPFPSSRGDGEGLGLWVCYQIVSQLHGRIDVEAVGAATRVRVDLPLHPEIER